MELDALLRNTKRNGKLEFSEYGALYVHHSIFDYAFFNSPQPPPPLFSPFRTVPPVRKEISAFLGNNQCLRLCALSSSTAASEPLRGCALFPFTPAPPAPLCPRQQT